jgi:hypothetical protein
VETGRSEVRARRKRQQHTHRRRASSRCRADPAARGSREQFSHGKQVARRGQRVKGKVTAASQVAPEPGAPRTTGHRIPGSLRPPVPQRRGPPRIMKEISWLPARMATDNPAPGHSRLQGALKNLDHRVARGPALDCAKASAARGHPRSLPRAVAIPQRDSNPCSVTITFSPTLSCTCTVATPREEGTTKIRSLGTSSCGLEGHDHHGER